MFIEMSLVIFLFGLAITATVALGLYQERENLYKRKNRQQESDSPTLRIANPRKEDTRASDAA